MKNKRIKFGDIEVINPMLVMKAGIVYDHYKLDILPQLWREAEERAPGINPTFEADDLFFQEEIQEGAVWYSFRFYTPRANIKEVA